MNTCITFTSNGLLDVSVTGGSGEPVSFVIQPERGKSLSSKRGGNYVLSIYFGFGQTRCLQRRAPSNFYFRAILTDMLAVVGHKTRSSKL